MKMVESSQNRWKTQWKNIELQTRKNQGLFGKGLTPNFPEPSSLESVSTHGVKKSTSKGDIKHNVKKDKVRKIVAFVYKVLQDWTVQTKDQTASSV